MAEFAARIAQGHIGKAKYFANNERVRSNRETIMRLPLQLGSLAAAFVAAVSTALSILHPNIPLGDLVFEAVSAIGTVGLTRDVTPQLSPTAKIIVALAMFVGRVGVLTLVMGLIPRRQRSAFRYPETNIILS